MLEDPPDRVTHLRDRVTRDKAVASSQATRMPGDPQVRATRSHKKQGSDQHPRWGYFGPPTAPHAPQTCELVLKGGKLLWICYGLLFDALLGVYSGDGELIRLQGVRRVDRSRDGGMVERIPPATGPGISPEVSATFGSSQDVAQAVSATLGQPSGAGPARSPRSPPEVQPLWSPRAGDGGGMTGR